MNIFKNTAFTWPQIALLKLSVLLIGIAVGANWPAVFVSYTWPLVIVAVVLGIYLVVVWRKE